MPRPKKAETTVVVEEKKSDGLIALKHFAKKGKLFIGGESYDIVDNVVKVKPEHVIMAKEHIKLGG